MERVRDRQQLVHNFFALRGERVMIASRLEEIDAMIAAIATLPDLTAKRDTLSKNLSEKRLYVLRLEEALTLHNQQAAPAVANYLETLNNGWNDLEAWGKGEDLQNGRFALVQAVIDAEDALRAEENKTPVVRAALDVIDLRGQLATLAKKIREIGTYQTVDALKTEKQRLIVRQGQAEIEEKLKPAPSRLPLLTIAVALVALALLIIYSQTRSVTLDPRAEALGY